MSLQESTRLLNRNRATRANPSPLLTQTKPRKRRKAELRFNLTLAQGARGGGVAAVDAVADAQRGQSQLRWVQLRPLRQLRFPRQFRLAM
jgi:hypothetical protein